MNQNANQFMGYLRENGTVGVRNYVLILPTVVCANATARSIASMVPGTTVVTHQHGCAQLGADFAQTQRTLIGLGKNPNVRSVLVVGLGCENMEGETVAASIATTGKRVELITIQKLGGTLKATELGVRIASEMMRTKSADLRVPVGIEKLTLALECGASDATSGITANPATGIAVDMLVEKGGSAILSETPEMIGAEHILAKRCSSTGVKDDLYGIIGDAEKGISGMGVDIRGSNPTPGNIAGGLSSIEEKSLGCIYKAGVGTIMQVVRYAETPTEKGLVIMDTPGHDVESMTGMAAGGAQVCVFTTGLGAVTGFPIMPVIKVCGNPWTSAFMSDNIDIDAGQVLDGKASLQQVAEQILCEVMEVSSGKATKAESLGYADIAINRIGPTT